jgi:hypothetical protein
MHDTYGSSRSGREGKKMSEGAAAKRAKARTDEHTDTAGALLRTLRRSVSDESAGAIKAEFEVAEKANRNVSGLVRKRSSEDDE